MRIKFVVIKLLNFDLQLRAVYVVSAHKHIPVDRDEFYLRFICNKVNRGRKVIFLSTVHVILLNMVFQLHGVLFSRAV